MIENIFTGFPMSWFDHITYDKKHLRSMGVHDHTSYMKVQKLIVGDFLTSEHSFRNSSSSPLVDIVLLDFLFRAFPQGF